MNSCFEKFVDFKGIMSDVLDRIVASKKWCFFFHSIKISQRNIIFSYFIKLLEYQGKFQSSYETNKSVGNIMRLILEEVIMSDRHMSDEQLWLFLQVFFNTERISLNEDWTAL